MPFEAQGPIKTDHPFTQQIYTVTEIAAIFGVNERTIAEYIADGRIKAVKVGRSWIITRSNLFKWLDGA